MAAWCGPALADPHEWSALPHPLLENWKIGKSLWITPFFPYKSTTYAVPIVQCNIGKSVNPFQNWKIQGTLKCYLSFPPFQFSNGVFQLERGSGKLEQDSRDCPRAQTQNWHHPRLAQTDHAQSNYSHTHAENWLQALLFAGQRKTPQGKPCGVVDQRVTRCMFSRRRHAPVGISRDRQSYRCCDPWQL